MQNDVASIMLEHFTPEKIYEHTGVIIDKTILPREKDKQQEFIIPSLEDEEDFINEHGEFSYKPKLYDDQEGPASLAFYGLAGDVVRAIDPHTEADPMATLITFLIGFGNLIGDNAHFMAGARKHPCRIFAVVVGESGKGRKGASLGNVRLLFRAVDPTWERDHITTGISSGEGLIYAVRDEVIKKIPIFEGEGKDKEIIDYEYKIIDEGIEDKRLFVIEEEFGKTLRAAKRQGNTVSAIIRELWDSGSPRTLTKNPIKTTAAHVSILGQITPEELKREVCDVDLVNGLANRFLWLMVERSKILPSGGFFHRIDVAPLIKKIKAAVEFARRTGEMTRDKEAEKLWEKVYEPLSTGVKGIVGSVTSRAEAQSMRLACLYALLDQSSEIKVIHLKAALELWNYCFKSARFIFGNAEVLENKNAKKLLDELRKWKEEGKGGMTRTEVSREVFKGNVSKQELDSIFKDLISNGFIKVEKLVPKGRKKKVQIISLVD